MSKHTPGPWEIAPSKRSDNYCIYAIDRQYGIGEAWNLNGESQNEANARLIAAAPDMLAALRYVEMRCVSDAAYPHSSIEDRRMRDLVVAAIARAEGRNV